MKNVIKKFLKIHRKTPVLGPFSLRLLTPAQTPTQVFKSTFLESTFRRLVLLKRDALRDLAHFVQFKKYENTHARGIL